MAQRAVSCEVFRQGARVADVVAETLVGDVLVDEDLRAEQLGDAKTVRGADTHREGDRPEEVTAEELATTLRYNVVIQQYHETTTP